MRYLSEIFWRHSWGLGTLFPNNSEFLVCFSVCLFAYFYTEIIQMQGYLQFWMRYFSETFSTQSWDAGTGFPNNSEFLYVSQSVCLLTSLPKLDKGISPDLEKMSFLEFSGHILEMLAPLFQIILIFLYVCQCISCLTFLLKLG